ncbi:MAG TPA: 2-C-methyl-D-erythritol 4-phosphate cytidylyltransferase [Nocardioidaceae bacterium]
MLTHVSQVAAIVPAAGSGSRLAAAPTDSGLPKPLRRLGRDTLLRHAVRSVERHADQIVVPAPAEWIDEIRASLADVPLVVDVVEGGPTRQRSVELALAAVERATPYVLVHDAARPLTPSAVTERVVAALRAGAQAVVPAVDVVDTLRQVTTDNTSRTMDRSSMRAVQTPQGFATEVLRQAHIRAGHDQATDDASLAESLGVDVVIVEGDVLAFKVTTALDLRLAEVVVSRDEAQEPT